MDESTRAPEAYDEDIPDIQNDDDFDDGADLLESVIQHELAKFHEQQAVKYAEISAAGQWAPLSLPSPAPVQQQIRAEERQQLELLQSDLEHQQHDPESYVPSRGALAVEQLWQQQVEQQAEHQQHQEQRSQPFSSHRPWSADADEDCNAASNSHATYTIDATAVQQQELAVDCGADGDAAGQVQSAQLPGCCSAVMHNMSADAPASHIEAEGQEAADFELHAGQEQSGQLDSCRGMSVEAGAAEEAVLHTAAPAVSELVNTDAEKQRCCFQEGQQGLSAAEAVNERSTSRTSSSAHEAGVDTEAAVRTSGVTDAAEQLCCSPQQVQRSRDWAAPGVHDDPNTRGTPLLVKEPVPDAAAAVCISGVDGPDANVFKDGELHWANVVRQEQQQQCEQQRCEQQHQQQQQGWEQQQQVGQLQQDEEKASGVARVYSEGQQVTPHIKCSHDGLLQHPVSQQHSEEAVASGLLQQQPKEGGCAGTALAAEHGNVERQSDEAPSNTGCNSISCSCTTLETCTVADDDGSLPMASVSANVAAAAARMGSSSSDSGWMVLPTAGPIEMGIGDNEAQQSQDTSPPAGGLTCLQSQVATRAANAVHTSQCQYMSECNAAAEVMPATTADGPESENTSSALKNASSSSLRDSCGATVVAVVVAATRTEAAVLPEAEPVQFQTCEESTECSRFDHAADDLGIYQDPDECDDSSSCSTPAAAAAVAVAAAVSRPGGSPSYYTAAEGEQSPPPCVYSGRPRTALPASVAASDAAGSDYPCGVQHAAPCLRSLSLNQRASSIGGSGGATVECLGTFQPPDCSNGAAQQTGSNVSITACPTDYYTSPAAAYDGYRSSSSCSPHPPHEEEQQQQQQQRRPVHSRNRPSGSQSPLLQAAKAAGLGCGPLNCSLGAGVVGSMVRPGSAPCQQSFSPTKPSYVGSNNTSRCQQQQGWIPGGAMATQQQLQQVHIAYRTARSASSCNGGKTATATAAGAMLLRPHTSGGSASSRAVSVSPMYQRPPWQLTTAREVAQVSTAADVAADNESASRRRTECGHQQQQQQQEQQQSLRPRTCSAPRARIYEPLLQQSNATRRPCSSRMYTSNSSGSATRYRQVNWQQQQQYNVLPLFEDGTAADEQQRWVSDEWANGLQSHDKRAQQQQQQQQQRQRPLPAWDASPIPLNTPKTVPIADATQPAEALVATKVNRAACTEQLANTQQHMHLHVAGSGAAVVRPRTAGAAGAAAIMREHPDSIGAGAHAGSGSSSSSVYLVEIQQKLKQANSCCRKLGSRRYYYMAPSTKARWNVDQITVEVWQFVANVGKIADPQQGEQQQQQQGGWQLRAHLSLYQFDRQLEKLIAKAATHAAAAADPAAAAAAGHTLNGSAAYAHPAYQSASNWTSLSSSPAGSRGASPDRSRPTSAVAQAARLGSLSLPLRSLQQETGGRRGSRLSPRRQAAMLQQQQQQQEQQGMPQPMTAAAAAGVDGGPGKVEAGDGAAVLPYGVPAWLQEHL